MYARQGLFLRPLHEQAADAATPVGRLDDEFIDERGAAFVEQGFVKNDGDETDYDLSIRGDEIVVYFGRPVHRVQD